MAVRPPTSLAFASGLLIDVAIVDPPNALDPVAGLGHVVRTVERGAPSGRCSRRAFGAIVAIGLPLAVFEATRRIERRCGVWFTGAALLALASSHRTLFARVADVRDALERSDLEEARRLLGYHLVSRDTSELGVAEVSAAAIESLVENIGDGVIAPWLAFAVGGAPLAWAYRTPNTVDSMWGYRNERYEDLGKAAAYIDDVWNLVPARLTALAICVSALGVRRGSEAFRVWHRDVGQTSSPNAGQPMSAMAGAVGVRLGKSGDYELNAGGRAATWEDIATALRVARWATAVVGTGLLAAHAWRGGRT